MPFIRVGFLALVLACSPRIERFSTQPQVNPTLTLSPEVAIRGTTAVAVKGAPNGAKVTVTIAGRALPVAADGTFFVGDGIPAGIVAVTLAVVGGSSPTSQSLLVLDAAPVLTSVVSDRGLSQGVPGDHITISGVNFDPRGTDRNLVTLTGAAGDTVANVLSATATTIVAQLPADIHAVGDATGDKGGDIVVRLSLVALNSSASNTLDFLILSPPKIVGMSPPKPIPGEQVAIYFLQSPRTLLGANVSDTMSDCQLASSLTLALANLKLASPLICPIAHAVAAPASAGSVIEVRLPSTPLGASADLLVDNGFASQTTTIALDRGGNLATGNAVTTISREPNPLLGEVVDVPIDFGESFTGSSPRQLGVARVDAATRRVTVNLTGYYPASVRVLPGTGALPPLVQAEVRSVNGGIYGRFYFRNSVSAETHILRLDSHAPGLVHPGTDFGSFVRAPSGRLLYAFLAATGTAATLTVVDVVDPSSVLVARLISDLSFPYLALAPSNDERPLIFESAAFDPLSAHVHSYYGLLFPTGSQRALRLYRLREIPAAAPSTGGAVCGAELCLEELSLGVVDTSIEPDYNTHLLPSSLQAVTQTDPATGELLTFVAGTLSVYTANCNTTGTRHLLLWQFELTDGALAAVQHQTFALPLPCEAQGCFNNNCTSPYYRPYYDSDWGEKIVVSDNHLFLRERGLTFNNDGLGAQLIDIRLSPLSQVPSKTLADLMNHSLSVPLVNNTNSGFLEIDKSLATVIPLLVSPFPALDQSLAEYQPIATTFPTFNPFALRSPGKHALGVIGARGVPQKQLLIERVSSDPSDSDATIVVPLDAPTIAGGVSAAVFGSTVDDTIAINFDSVFGAMVVQSLPRDMPLPATEVLAADEQLSPQGLLLHGSAISSDGFDVESFSLVSSQPPRAAWVSFALDPPVPAALPWLTQYPLDRRVLLGAAGSELWVATPAGISILSVGAPAVVSAPTAPPTSAGAGMVPMQIGRAQDDATMVVLWRYCTNNQRGALLSTMTNQANVPTIQSTIDLGTTAFPCISQDPPNQVTQDQTDMAVGRDGVLVRVPTASANSFTESAASVSFVPWAQARADQHGLALATSATYTQTFSRSDAPCIRSVHAFGVDFFLRVADAATCQGAVATDQPGGIVLSRSSHAPFAFAPQSVVATIPASATDIDDGDGFGSRTGAQLVFTETVNGRTGIGIYTRDASGLSESRQLSFSGVLLATIPQFAGEGVLVRTTRGVWSYR